MPKCLKTKGFRHFLVPEIQFLSKGQTFSLNEGQIRRNFAPRKMKKTG